MAELLHWAPFALAVIGAAAAVSSAIAKVLEAWDKDDKGKDDEVAGVLKKVAQKLIGVLAFVRPYVDKVALRK